MKILTTEQFAAKIFNRVKAASRASFEYVDPGVQMEYMRIADAAADIMSGFNATKPRKRSKNQAVGTPPEFIEAVRRKFGTLEFDLAADDTLHVCERYYTPVDDALSPETPWPVTPGYTWLNPPFSKIEPWVKRCAEESRKHPACRILCLVPASLDAVWYRRWVKGYAKPFCVAPRVKFIGFDWPFPKPLMLLRYDKYLEPYESLDFETFEWKKEG